MSLTRLTTDPENGMYPSAACRHELAFMSWRNGPAVVRDAPTDQSALLSMPPGSAIDPRWSPDGSRIVFMAGPETDPNAWQSDSDQRAIRGRGQDRSTRLR